MNTMPKGNHQRNIQNLDISGYHQNSHAQRTDNPAKSDLFGIFHR